jgi:hypothetical protein
MALFRVGRLLLWFSIYGLIAAGFLLVTSAHGLLPKEARPAAAEEPSPAPAPLSGSDGLDGPCLKCHADPALSMTYHNGDVLSLYLDGEIPSVCSRDEVGVRRLPQRNLAIPTRRRGTEQTAAGGCGVQACKRCHFENYTARWTHALRRDGKARDDAPICTDCHAPTASSA